MAYHNYATPRPSTEEQVNWNLSQKISEQIDILLRAGRKNSVLGNVLECFFMFKEIRLLINHHLNPEQLGAVDKLEDNINFATIKIKKLGIIEDDDFEFDGDSSKIHRVKRKLIQLRNDRILLVERYRKSVLRLLDAYGYLMERKTDSSYME